MAPLSPILIFGCRKTALEIESLTGTFYVRSNRGNFMSQSQFTFRKAIIRSLRFAAAGCALFAGLSHYASASEEFWVFECGDFKSNAGVVLPSPDTKYSVKMSGITRAGGEPNASLVIARGGTKAELELETGYWAGPITRDKILMYLLAFDRGERIRVRFTTIKAPAGMATSVVLERESGRTKYFSQCR